ncbi:hypothetical protein HZY93_08720, partial [Streptococcus danieliae]|nr:hypothetical protein [Streptococcus danieliae]NYS49965.1 hypothetical protein [Streptococcus danieliae]
RGLFTMGKTNTRALSLKKPPRFKASCLQSWRFFDIPCYWALTIDLTTRIERLNWVIRGWVNYFSLGNMKTILTQIDERLRTRIR